MIRRSICRPAIGSITSGAELRRWYWLKEELVTHAREVGVKTVGAKFTILDRLAHFVDTGETLWPGDSSKKTISKFDWHKEPLTLDTAITDNYRNSQNVRRFFEQHVGPGFKFNIAFMDWMKASAGKTMRDAIDEYHRQRIDAAKPGFKTDIRGHNQFNQYTRDFLADNPKMEMGEVQKFWAAKRELPSDDGRHVYVRTDLDLLD